MLYTHVYHVEGVSSPIHRCVYSNVYSVISWVLWKHITGIYYSVGIRTHDLCNSGAVSYQLDYRDCPVSRVSLNPMFWQRVPQRYIRCLKLHQRLRVLTLVFYPLKLAKWSKCFILHRYASVDCLMVSQYEQRSDTLCLNYLICRGWQKVMRKKLTFY